MFPFPHAHTYLEIVKYFRFYYFFKAALSANFIFLYIYIYIKFWFLKHSATTPPPVSFLIHQVTTATRELGYLGLSHTVIWHCHLPGSSPFFQWLAYLLQPSPAHLLDGPFRPSALPKAKPKRRLCALSDTRVPRERQSIFTRRGQRGERIRQSSPEIMQSQPHWWWRILFMWLLHKCFHFQPAILWGK